jgi:predicted AAA+ superfamily ATPase
MSVGGMPEYVLKMDSNYLKDLVDDIINKDIVAMYGVKDVQILKDFFVLLMERSGKILSINKIGKILKIAPDTSRRYLKMFEDTYLIYVVQRSGKTNEMILSPKKIYAADLGIRTSFTGIRDLGSFFENYVFLKIRNYLPKYVYQEGYEIDFLTAGKTLIEVKYGLPMNEDQSRLFNSTEAKKKMIINGIIDMNKLEGIG